MSDPIPAPPPPSVGESFREQVGRVIEMSRDLGDTWDLSDSDQAALKAVLRRLSELDAEVERLRADLTAAREAVDAALDANEATKVLKARISELNAEVERLRGRDRRDAPADTQETVSRPPQEPHA